ncbi:MAG: alpha/beta hydrolase [Planctomycetales bacterium]|nr:alpha/beta hydrolase [Planctomycetales bacterium]
MAALPTLVFPGLDGSVEMLTEFAAAVPPEFDVRLQPLPPQMAGYDDLVEHFDATIRETGPCAIVAESFSGPLAVQLAHAHPEQVALLTLVASFVASPRPYLLRAVPWRLVMRMPLPNAAARRMMLGSDATREQVASLQQVLRRADPAVLGGRLREVARVDVTNRWRELRCPALCLAARRDRLLATHDANALIAANPHAQAATIDGSHLLLATRPTECWREIVRFANQHQPASQ